QAEDGIRDPLVTGVQTCALPILLERLMATPVGLPLFNAMLPPVALRRRNFAEPRSAEEASIREFTAMESLVEVRFTVPPLPWGSDRKSVVRERVELSGVGAIIST